MNKKWIVSKALLQELEAAYGAVTPLQQPEDFQKLRDQAIEDHVVGLYKELTKSGATYTIQQGHGF